MCETKIFSVSRFLVLVSCMEYHLYKSVHLFLVHGPFAYMYVWAPHECLVPSDARGENRIPWKQMVVNCHVGARN